MFYRPQKVYAKDLEYINSLLLNEARIGIMFQEPSKIIESVKSFNNKNNAKHNFLELEEELNR